MTRSRDAWSSSIEITIKGDDLDCVDDHDYDFLPPVGEGQHLPFLGRWQGKTQWGWSRSKHTWKYLLSFTSAISYQYLTNTIPPQYLSVHCTVYNLCNTLPPVSVQYLFAITVQTVYSIYLWKLVCNMFAAYICDNLFTKKIECQRNSDQNSHEKKWPSNHHWVEKSLCQKKARS